MNTNRFNLLLRRLLTVGLYSLLLIPFIISYSTTFPYIFGKAIAFRVVVEILATLWIALMLFDPLARPKKSLILWALAANAAVLLVTTMVGVDPHHSFWGGFERMGGAFNDLHALVLAFIAVSVFRTEKDWLRFWRWAMVTATVMAGIAIVQRFSSVDIFGVHGGRVDGTFGNSIYLGQFALFFFFIGLISVVQAKDRRARLFLFFSTFLQIPVILFTESRGVLLGLFVGVVFFLFWWLFHPKLYDTKYKRPALFVGIVGIILFGGIFYFGNRLPLIRSVPGLRSFNYEQFRFGGGTTTRLINWEIALTAWKTWPYFGWGPENYRFAFDHFFNSGLLKYSFSETWFDRSHNGFLDILATQGIFGGLAVLFLYSAVAIAHLRTSHNGRLAAIRSGLGIALFVAYLTQFLFAFDSTVSLVLLALFYGWTVRLYFGDSAATTVPYFEKAPMTKRFLVVITASCGLLLLGYVHVPAVRANASLFQISKAMYQEDFTRALAERQRVLAIQTPYLREVRKEIGFFVTQKLSDHSKILEADRESLWLAGGTDLRDNIRSFPFETDERYHFIRLMLLGDVHDTTTVRAAELEAQNAIRYSPWRQHLRYELAEALLFEKRPNAAVAAMRDAIQLDPEISDSHWYLGFALSDAGNSSGSYFEVMKALALGYEPKNSDEWSYVSKLAEGQGKISDAYWYAGLSRRMDGNLLEAYRLFGNAVASGYRWKDSTDVFLLSYLARDVGEYSVAYRLIKNELGPWMSKLDPIEYDARLAEAAFRAGDFFAAYDAAARAVRARPSIKTRLAPMLAPGAGTR